MTPKSGKAVRPPPANPKEYRPIDFRPRTTPVPPDLLIRLRQLRVEAKRVHRHLAGAARERYCTNRVGDHPEAAARAVARLEELLTEATKLAHELLGLSFGHTPESYREQKERLRND